MDGVTFAPIVAEDFPVFERLRKSVMRPHVERQNLPWDEEAETRYHHELFNEPGLRKISLNGVFVGFIGVRAKNTSELEIGRFCVVPGYQGQGLGAAVLEKIRTEAANNCQDIVLDVLKMNPARRLYERCGFLLEAEDHKLAYYRRPHQGTVSP